MAILSGVPNPYRAAPELPVEPVVDTWNARRLPARRSIAPLLALALIVIAAVEGVAVAARHLPAAFMLGVVLAWLCRARR